MDLSIIQGPTSVAPCLTLISRFANLFVAVPRPPSPRPSPPPRVRWAAPPPNTPSRWWHLQHHATVLIIERHGSILDHAFPEVYTASTWTSHPFAPGRRGDAVRGVRRRGWGMYDPPRSRVGGTEWSRQSDRQVRWHLRGTSSWG